MRRDANAQHREDLYAILLPASVQKTGACSHEHTVRQFASIALNQSPVVEFAFRLVAGGEIFALGYQERRAHECSIAQGELSASLRGIVPGGALIALGYADKAAGVPAGDAGAPSIRLELACRDG